VCRGAAAWCTMCIDGVTKSVRISVGNDIRVVGKRFCTGDGEVTLEATCGYPSTAAAGTDRDMVHAARLLPLEWYSSSTLPAAGKIATPGQVAKAGTAVDPPTTATDIGIGIGIDTGTGTGTKVAMPMAVVSDHVVC